MRRRIYLHPGTREGVASVEHSVIRYVSQVGVTRSSDNSQSLGVDIP
jgi:hypothetical protein